MSLAASCDNEIKIGHWDMRGGILYSFLKVYSKKRGETFFSFPPVGWNMGVMTGTQTAFWEFKQLKPWAEGSVTRWGNLYYGHCTSLDN